MRVQILHIADCPNWEKTEEDIAAVLRELDAQDVELESVLLTTPEEAAEVAFAGSPTILIDGVDAFPSSGATANLACRIYRTGGRFAGSPSTADLLEVFGTALTGSSAS